MTAFLKRHWFVLYMALNLAIAAAAVTLERKDGPPWCQRNDGEIIRCPPWFMGTTEAVQ